MVRHSPLSPENYREALKENFISPWHLFSRRVTGWTLGNWFSAAYYQEYEWNRKITSESSRCIGFLKEVEGKTEIHYVQWWGYLSPGWLGLYFVLSEGIFLLSEWAIGELFWVSILVSAAIALVACLATTVEASMTQGGMEAWTELERCLQNPKEFY